MDNIVKLVQTNWGMFFITLVAIGLAIKEILELISYFKNKFGITTSANEENKELINRISTLERHDKWQYDELIKISSCLEKINKSIIDKEIDDIRWELLDFCSALTSGRKYNREAFAHIFKTYEKYEKILDENGLTNGYVQESMNAVKEIYHDKLVRNDFD